jgi:hypothetical protein
MEVAAMHQPIRALKDPEHRGEQMRGMRRLGRIAAALIAVIVFLQPPGLISAAQTLDYPAGFRLIQVPDPLAERNPAYPLSKQKEPALGKPFFDPQFGTILTRVTNRSKIRHEYSRFDPFNADKTMIILTDTDSGGFMVFRTKGPDYAAKQNLVSRVEWTEPRWDPVDPHRLWGFDELKIVSMDTATGQTKVVKDFAQDPVMGKIIKAESDLYQITTKEEGEPSRDFRYWALALQGSQDDYRIRHLFCWDRDQDKILGHMPLTAKEAGPIDWVGMSPLGKWVIVGGDSDGGRKTAGLNIADPGFAKWHNLAVSTAHSDVGLDVQGREVLIMQNTSTDHIDLIPLDPKARPVTSSNGYNGNMIRPLVRLFYSSDDPAGFSGGVHISCNAPGYCVVSTYYESEAPERNWPEKNWLDRSIILVKLDPDRPQAWYLANVHNTTGAYWEETQASISRDGSRIVWASNWGAGPGQEQVFVMELVMPPDWRGHLK